MVIFELEFQGIGFAKTRRLPMIRRRLSFYVANLLFLLILCIQLESQAGVPAAQSPDQTPSGSQTLPQAQASTQEKQGPASDSIPVLRTTTRLVVVDVVALDDQNKPVANLEAHDFTMLEEGKPQQVRVFSFQHPAVDVALKTRPKLPPNVFTNSPSYRVNSSFNVILLDALNTQFADMAYAHQQVIQFLKKMPSEQPVAIYSLEGNKVRLLQDFTTDAGVLRAAVEKFRWPTSLLLSSGPDNAGGRLNETIQRVEQDRISFRVDYTVAALGYIAQTLSGYPGRKNLIWVSAAFPFNVNPDFQVTGSFDRQSHDAEIAKAADALINSQVAIYPVDPRGLTAPEVFSASNSGRDSSGRALGGPGLQAALSRESSVRFAEHSTMNEMAGKTGGRSFYNRNDIATSIRQSIDDGSTYYTLGYYPENKKWDGKFRKIQVKVNRPGIKLRYRLGYFAVDPQPRRESDPKKQDFTFVQSLNLELPVSTSVLFHAGVLPRSSQAQNRIPVNFRIDPRAVNFEQQADGLQHGQVHCGGRAYSEKGKPVRLQISSVEYKLKPESFQQMMQTGFPCQLTLDLPNGSYLLRLGVMDNRSGLIGTTNAKVTVQ
jgi:VWFA-related protein